MKRYLFVGLPKVGKSFWGVKIAHHLKLSFFDTDQLLLRLYQQPCRKLIQRQGWKWFRDAESFLLQIWRPPTDQGWIVACGGGLLLKKNNQKIIRSWNVPIIYLDTPLKTLAKRHEQSQRGLYCSREPIIPFLQARKNTLDELGWNSKIAITPETTLEDILKALP